jgi:hypothetical protein
MILFIETVDGINRSQGHFFSGGMRLSDLSLMPKQVAKDAAATAYLMPQSRLRLGGRLE